MIPHGIQVADIATAIGTVAAGGSATIAAARTNCRVVVLNASIFRATSTGEISISFGGTALADTGWDLTSSVSDQGWLAVPLSISAMNQNLTVQAASGTGTAAYRVTWAYVPS